MSVFEHGLNQSFLYEFHFLKCFVPFAMFKDLFVNILPFMLLVNLYSSVVWTIYATGLKRTKDFEGVLYRLQC